jgi:hypothetical protein
MISTAGPEVAFQDLKPLLLAKPGDCWRSARPEPMVAVTMMKPVLDYYLALVVCLSRQNTRNPVRRMLARRRMLAAIA